MGLAGQHLGVSLAELTAAAGTRMLGDHDSKSYEQKFGKQMAESLKG